MPGSGSNALPVHYSILVIWGIQLTGVTTTSCGSAEDTPPDLATREGQLRSSEDPIWSLWGTGNNGPVSTAMGSSFLNGPGARCRTGGRQCGWNASRAYEHDYIDTNSAFTRYTPGQVIGFARRLARAWKTGTSPPVGGWTRWTMRPSPATGSARATSPRYGSGSRPGHEPDSRYDRRTATTITSVG
jgi:hypothetical protein